MPNRNTIRKTMRQKRAGLASGDLRSASLSAAALFLKTPLYQQSNHIGFYMANNGELDPAPALSAALAAGKCCYLPTLDPANENQLIYVRYHAGESLVKNRYDILEPTLTSSNIIGAKMMDLVLVPLVSFDSQGHRLGMGKGYYDRTFAFKNEQEITQNPILIGYAYEFQKSPDFATKPWDVPLEHLISDKDIYHF